MSVTAKQFLEASAQVALVEVREAAGSTPRDVGAWMLVSKSAIFGTIGGGQVEFRAIERARSIFAGSKPAALLDLKLGPEIGQCCGGRLVIDIAVVDETLRQTILVRSAHESAVRPTVAVFGAGHVGKALVRALAPLPLAVSLVETREEELVGLPSEVTARLTALPEAEVRAAPPGAAYVVLTHDHALDFLIVAAALARDDAAYVGMIGSKTKRATFRSWYLKEAGGEPERLARLVCPIGGSLVSDKRPAVIAVLAAAEIATALLHG